MNTQRDTLNLEYRTGDCHTTRPSPRTEPLGPSVGRGALFSACPHGAAVCADWRLREAGLCLECWAGVLERANAHSEWLRSA